MIVGYVQGSKSPTMLGNLKDGCTITIEGVVYDIPDYAQDGDRVRAAVAEAGYRVSGLLRDAISGVDEHGGYAIELERL